VIAAGKRYIAGALRQAFAEECSRRPSTTSSTRSPRCSGSQPSSGSKAISYVSTLGGVKEACVAGKAGWLDCPARGAGERHACPCDETDDSHAPSLTHPGCASYRRRWRWRSASGAAASELTAVAARLRRRLQTDALADPYQFREDGHSTHSFGADVRRGRGRGPWPRERRAPGCDTSFLMRRSKRRDLLLDARPDHIEKAFDFGGCRPATASRGGHGRARFTGVEDGRGEPQLLRRVRRAPQPEVLARRPGRNLRDHDANIKRVGGLADPAPLDSLAELIKETGLKSG